MYNYDDNEMYSQEPVNYRTVQEPEIVYGPLSNKPKRGKKVVRFIAAALAFGLIAGGAFEGVNLAVGHFNDKAVEGETADSLTQADNPQIQNEIANISTSAAGDASTIVSDVSANAMPSIVAINCTSVSSASDVFGRTYQQPTAGSGSGIIIGQNDTQVLIATNNHVVAGSDANVEIIFSDGSTAKATIKGTDSTSDLAVVAVNLSDLSEETKNSIRVAAIGDSDSVKVGQMAIAIGNALGYGQSVTVGYISAVNRTVSLEDATMTLLQTDAAINPGNSGGALLNANGEVIGINSVKYASTDVEGIGYAIPISTAIPIINDLMNRETLSESERAYLGIKGEDVPESYTERFNVPTGVFVAEVTKGSPAEKAGLTAGSVIVGINGKIITKMEQLQEILSYTKAGETAVLDVRYLDNGEYKEKQLTVTFGNRPTLAQK